MSDETIRHEVEAALYPFKSALDKAMIIGLPPIVRECSLQIEISERGTPLMVVLKYWFNSRNRSYSSVRRAWPRSDWGEGLESVIGDLVRQVWVECNREKWEKEDEDNE